MNECIQEGATKLREPLEWFAWHMEEKLRANDHKGHWGNCSVGYLTRRLGEELRELLVILHGAHFHDLTTDEAHHVVLEAADIANFAMMIADNAKPFLVDAETRERMALARQNAAPSPTPARGQGES